MVAPRGWLGALNPIGVCCDAAAGPGVAGVPRSRRPGAPPVPAAKSESTQTRDFARHSTGSFQSRRSRRPLSQPVLAARAPSCAAGAVTVTRAPAECRLGPRLRRPEARKHGSLRPCGRGPPTPLPAAGGGHGGSGLPLPAAPAGPVRGLGSSAGAAGILVRVTQYQTRTRMILPLPAGDSDLAP